MKKIAFLCLSLFFICLVFFAPKAYAFEIIPDLGDDYKTENQIALKTSSILGNPSLVAEKYDNITKIKKRLYRYNVAVDMLLDKGQMYFCGGGISLSISNTFEEAQSSETIITTSMDISISTTFSSEIGVDGIGKTGASSAISTNFGQSYGISESYSIRSSQTVTMSVSSDAKRGYYRLETRTKCVVYYIVEYIYSSSTKCWFRDCYYVFDALDDFYIALTRYQASGNKFIYDDVKDSNCFYFSFSYLD